MKTKFYGLFLALLGAMFLTSCDKDDDLRLSEVPDAVLDSFEAKFPGAGRTEWEKKRGYIVAEFRQDGMDTQVWYDSDGGWLMTEFDLGFNLSVLPQAVQDAVQGSQYAAWYVEDIHRYERANEVFYLIEVETKGEKDRNLYYNEEGTLLKDEVDRENDDVTPDTTL